MNGLTVEFENRATVLRLNAAEPANAALQQQVGLRGHPAFAILDATGEVTGRFLGPQEADTLRNALAAVAVAP